MNCRAIYAVFFALLMALLAITARADTSAADATGQVARQFREFCLQESTDRGQRLLDDVDLPTAGVGQTTKLLAELREDGSWPDIDYPSNARSNWPAGEHLSRVLSMTVYARRSETPATDSKRCLAGIHHALAFWIQHDFKCPNWWYNDIGGPKILGTTALLLDADLLPSEFSYITQTVLPRSKVGTMTGQNKVWLAGNGVMRAALIHDESLLKKSAEVIAGEIHESEGAEGIQPDWSFHQHGPQQQFGNYGMAFAVEITKWSAILHGTPFAFPPRQQSIFRNYLLQGQNWVIWNGVMDISSCGRQISPNSPAKKASVLRGVMRSMTTLDTDHAADFQAFVTRNSPGGTNDLIGTKLFWRSDYLIARHRDWFVSLKMSSRRVIGGETVNSENLSGLHLADGATFIYHTGREYEDIFPAWNWRMIPGTTEAQDDASLNWEKKNARVQTTFVGGACDGSTAALAMDFARDKVTAKKAWFFTADAVVCLGAAINSTGDSAVITTLDQCLQTGPAGLVDHDHYDHAGTRYTTLTPEHLVILPGPRTGNWKSVFENPGTPKADVTKNILTLSIDHGTHPHDATYAYSITSTEQTNSPPIQIRSNTESLQAIEAGPKWSAAIFWSPGSAILSGRQIAVDQPCAVLLNDTNLTIADPTQQLKSVQVSIDGKAKTIDLPPGGNAGKSVTVPL